MAFRRGPDLEGAEKDSVEEGRAHHLQRQQEQETEKLYFLKNIPAGTIFLQI